MSSVSQFAEVNTISFDGDATLWDFDSVMRRSLWCVLQELRRLAPGEETERLTVAQMIRIRNAAAQELEGKRLGRIRLIAFQRTLEQVGVTDHGLAARLNALYRKYRTEGTELYPDVLPTLDALAARFRLGLLSNGNTYPEHCGLNGRFAFVVFSQDCGVAKPDPRIFDVVLEKAGCSRRQLLHVGDSLQTDVAGARNARVKSVWLNRTGARNNKGIEPDLEVTTLAGLLPLCPAA